VPRATKLRLRGLDEHGKPFERVVTGYLARAVQHEADHLDGMLFTDRLSLLKRQFLKRDLDALARGELPARYHPGAREGGIGRGEPEVVGDRASCSWARPSSRCRRCARSRPRATWCAW